MRRADQLCDGQLLREPERLRDRRQGSRAESDADLQLPARARFPREGHASEVTGFVRVFDDVAHRVFGAFHEPFAVVGQRDFAGRGICDGFKAPFAVVGQGRGVSVAVGDAFKASCRSGEFVDRLARVGQRVATCFGATQGVLGPGRCRERAACSFGEGNRAPFGLNERREVFARFDDQVVAEGA
jgi:hypothetical protein